MAGAGASRTLEDLLKMNKAQLDSLKKPEIMAVLLNASQDAAAAAVAGAAAAQWAQGGTFAKIVK